MFMDGRTDGCAESRLTAISPESFGQGQNNNNKKKQ